jgi:hypothetical protein
LSRQQRHLQPAEKDDKAAKMAVWQAGWLTARVGSKEHYVAGQQQ